MKEIVVHSLNETAALGEKLGSLLFPGSLITLTGDLGCLLYTSRSLQKSSLFKKT